MILGEGVRLRPVEKDDLFADNPRAIRAYEKAGFIKEGTLRQDEYHEGRFVDTVVMGILREEWLAARP